MTIEIWPVEGLPEIRDGDDLAAMLAEPLRAPRRAGRRRRRDHAEDRVEGRGARRPRRGRGPLGVGRRARPAGSSRAAGDLIIAETRHGFVCANAGVDASNVEAGFVSLLPVDPDGSAEAHQGGARRSVLGLARLGVVITDTFGRPWRNGLVNVAIGCAGLPALVDLRGEPDHHGRELEVTVVALADEVAAASGLVMGKSARVPAALVRGVDIASAAPGRGADLIRPPDEDLFREGTIEP